MAKKSELIFLGSLGLVVFLITYKYQRYLTDSQPLLMGMASNFIIGVGIVILVNFTLGEERKKDSSSLRSDFETKFTSLAQAVSKIGKNHNLH